jgi:hypothetical protein
LESSGIGCVVGFENPISARLFDRFATANYHDKSASCPTCFVGIGSESALHGSLQN